MKPGSASGTRPVCLLGTLTLLLFLAMVMHAARLSPSIPAIQFTYTAATFKAVLAQWGPGGIERFVEHFWIDFPFLASYGMFGYWLARRGQFFGEPDRPARPLLAWLLPAAAALDASENLLHLHFLAVGADPMEALYLVAGLVATGKWILIAAFIIGMMHLTLRSRR